MQAIIAGYKCELTVEEFGEICRMDLEAARQAARENALVDIEAGYNRSLFEEEKLGGLRSLVTLRMPSGEYLYFAHVADLIAHFPELKDYNSIGGFRSTDTLGYVRKQARKLYNHLKPENRFKAFIRDTTNNKCITATVTESGHIAIEVTEAA